MARLWKNFANGLWNENPTFRIMIGLCPVLAVTTSAKNVWVWDWRLPSC